MKRRLKLIKKRLFLLISIFAVFLFLLFVFKRIKAKELLNPFAGNLFKNKESLTDIGEEILGTADEPGITEKTKQVLGEGKKLVEASGVTEPLVNLRETITQKINETIVSIKELPEKEIKKIKKEVCREWMEEEN